MGDDTAIALGIGCGAGVILLGVLVWSIRRPGQRLWPPPHFSTPVALTAWGLTLAVFGSALWLGITGWGTLALASGVRWGLGLPLVIIGNLAVWFEVVRFGLATTSGGHGRLYTDGLYRLSRHPQYLADMAILVGWTTLSASLAVIPVTLVGLSVLALAPFAEEPWLKSQYGDEYRRYRQQVRRFL